MSHWKLELKAIGRGRATRTIQISAETLEDAEDRAIRECSKHLMSRDIGLLDKCNLTYTVVAGLRPVGKVNIISI